MDKILKKIRLMFLVTFSACFATVDESGTGTDFTTHRRERLTFEKPGYPTIIFDFEPDDLNPGDCERVAEQIFAGYKHYRSSVTDEYNYRYLGFQVREIVQSVMPNAVTLFDEQFEEILNSRISTVSVFGQIEGKLVKYGDNPALLYYSAYGEMFIIQRSRLYGNPELLLIKADPYLLEEVDLESGPYNELRELLSGRTKIGYYLLNKKKFATLANGSYGLKLTRRRNNVEFCPNDLVLKSPAVIDAEVDTTITRLQEVIR